MNQLGGVAAIALHPSRSQKPAFDQHLYRERHRIENLFARLKHYRRIADGAAIGGKIYSDALLHQASLVSDADPDLAIGDPTSMASEAVAFLADGMLSDEDESGPVAGSGVSHYWDTPDVMQTMLS